MAATSIRGAAPARQHRGDYLLPNLGYDRASILRDAWAKARHAVATYGLKLRDAFRDAFRRLWDQAKAYQATILWHRAVEAHAEAEATRRAALPTNLVAIEDARAALLDAEMSDGVTSHEAVREARAQLAAVQAAA